MNPYNLSLLLFSFCSFFVGLLILLKRGDETGRIFFVFSLFVAGWGIGSSWMYSNDYGAVIALESTRAAHVCSILIVPTWIHFVFSYLQIAQRKTRVLKTAYLGAFLLEPFVFSR